MWYSIARIIKCKAQSNGKIFFVKCFFNQLLFKVDCVCVCQKTHQVNDRRGGKRRRQRMSRAIVSLHLAYSVRNSLSFFAHYSAPYFYGNRDEWRFRHPSTVLVIFYHFAYCQRGQTKSCLIKMLSDQEREYVGSKCISISWISKKSMATTYDWVSFVMYMSSSFYAMSHALCHLQVYTAYAHTDINRYVIENMKAHAVIVYAYANAAQRTRHTHNVIVLNFIRVLIFGALKVMYLASYYKKTVRIVGNEMKFVRVLNLF